MSYEVSAKCKRSGCCATISLKAVPGFSYSERLLSYIGPPLLLRCNVCGQRATYSLKDLTVR
jgi:hypothetical protein